MIFFYFLNSICDISGEEGAWDGGGLCLRIYLSFIQKSRSSKSFARCKCLFSMNFSKLQMLVFDGNFQSLCVLMGGRGEVMQISVSSKNFDGEAISHLRSALETKLHQLFLSSQEKVETEFFRINLCCSCISF